MNRRAPCDTLLPHRRAFDTHGVTFVGLGSQAQTLSHKPVCQLCFDELETNKRTAGTNSNSETEGEAAESGYV